MSHKPNYRAESNPPPIRESVGQAVDLRPIEYNLQILALGPCNGRSEGAGIRKLLRHLHRRGYQQE